MLLIPIYILYRRYYNTSVKFKTQSHTYSPLTYTVNLGHQEYPLLKEIGGVRSE